MKIDDGKGAERLHILTAQFVQISAVPAVGQGHHNAMVFALDEHGRVWRLQHGATSAGSGEWEMLSQDRKLPGESR